MSAASPRRLGVEAEVAARQGRLEEPHIAPLSAFVRRLREQRGGGDAVPWFDPESGGVNSRLLILLEAPGARALGSSSSPRPAARGSGFISADNNDVTATNMYNLRREAGLQVQDVMHWNVVPWYVGDGKQIRPADQNDILEAQPALRELLLILPRLQVIVTMGRAAQLGWARYQLQEPTKLIHIPTFHPSPRAINRRSGVRETILHALCQAQRLLVS